LECSITHASSTVDMQQDSQITGCFIGKFDSVEYSMVHTVLLCIVYRSHGFWSSNRWLPGALVPNV